MKNLNTKFAVLALAVSAFAAQAQESDLQRQVDAATVAQSVLTSQSLEAVVVTGHSNPMLRSDQRLALLKASLPLGANGGAVEPTGVERVIAAFPQSPDTATGEARRMMERGQTPPAGSDADGSVAAGTW